ncbi:MAG: YcxB family protein [Verrucomicrobiota bacterium]
MSSESQTPPADDSALNLDLPVRLEVILDETADRAYWHLVRGPGREAQVSADFWLQMSPWYAGFAIGLYATLSSGMIFLACMIVAQSIYLIRHHWAQHKIQLYPPGVGAAPTTNIVEINENGIAETDRQVVSVIPWAAMMRWYLKDNILFVRLTNGRWLFVPSSRMKPAAFNLRRLCAFLKSKGVDGEEYKG